MKYTYSDEEDEGYSDATTTRRSTRNTGTHTPAEGLAPTVTLSGRQVKARQGGAYGESILSGTQAPAVAAGSLSGTSEEPENGEETGGRPRRAAAAKVTTNGWGSKGAHIEGYNSVDAMDSDEDDASEQDYGDDEEDDHVSLQSDVDDQDDLTDADEIPEDADGKKSLLVKLPVKTPTPEKKTSIKLRLTPDRSQSASAQAQSNNDYTEASSSKGHLQLSDSLPTASSPEDPSKPIDVPPMSPTVQQPTSPLALRGSPGKPHAFPSSINVK